MNQSLRENFFSEDELVVQISTNFTINASSLNLGNNITLYDANNFPGANGYFLTSNGSTVYWSNSGVGGFSTIAATRNYNIYTANADQNTFIVSTFSLIDVYYNGSHLANSDYFVVNSTAVQLASNAAAGDVLEFVGYAASLINADAQYIWNNTHTFTANIVANTAVLNKVEANGSYGLPNQVLLSNGNTVYWASISTLTVNTADQYIWSNTHTFTSPVIANVTFANVATYLVGSGITANTTALILANSIGVFANGSVGANGQVLSSNGSGVFWATPATFSVNTAATYAWTNTHSFSALVTYTANIFVGNATVNTVISNGAISLSGLSAGYLEMPINSQSANYVTVASDSGKTLLHPNTDNNARTFTIANNSTVPYANGTVISFINAANVLTIAINNDTLYAVGYASNTGSRTVNAYGMATAVKIAPTAWIISGVNMA